jgi:hypothetical protein
MRGKLFLGIIVAAAVLGGVLVAVAAADDTTALPDISASDLIARMGDHSQAPAAISGDISWTNDLFGDLPVAPEHAGRPAESPLLTSGSGRLWAQDDKLRLESQGSGGDQILVADAQTATVWTYTFADDTARLYQWAGDSPVQGEEGSDGGQTPDGDEPPFGPSHEVPTPERASAFLESAARFMTVDVTGQSVVAGRDAYVLTMTPAADDTALGKVEAAIDGETFVPLRLEVVAKGHEAPTLSFGFTRVSYDPVDADVFAFTPPEGATVEREAIDPQGDGHGGNGDATDGPEGDATDGSRDGTAPSEPGRADAMEQMKELARSALLSREEAALLVDFPLAWARDYTARDFRWVYVFDEGMPVNALGSPVFDMARMFGAGFTGGEDESNGDDAAGVSSPDTGPAAVLLYGEGFGTIALVQTKTTVETRDQLEQLPEVVDSIDLGGVQAKAVVTPLGSVVIWERDGVTLVAAGMVPRADLLAFAASVR